MKKLIFLLLITVPFIGFGQNNLGTWYEYSGWLLVGNWVDNEEDGLFQYYFENDINSQVQKEGVYKNGKPIGLWKEYYENGNTKKNKDWTNEIWRYYKDNGKLEKVLILKNGLKDFLFYYYYENGQLKWEGREANFVTIWEKCWDENGTEIECEE